MQDWQVVSAHRLSGFISGVLESVWRATGLVATGISVNGRDVRVEYEIKDGQAVGINALNRGDIVIGEEVARFNASQAFDRIAGFRVYVASEIDRTYHVVPLIATRFGIKNGINGRMENEGSCGEEGTGEGGEAADGWAEAQGENVCDVGGWRQETGAGADQ